MLCSTLYNRKKKEAKIDAIVACGKSINRTHDIINIEIYALRQRGLNLKRIPHNIKISSKLSLKSTKINQTNTFKSKTSL